MRRSVLMLSVAAVLMADTLFSTSRITFSVSCMVWPASATSREPGFAGADQPQGLGASAQDDAVAAAEGGGDGDLGVADAEGLATQLTLLVDGSIAQDLVRDDPAMARAAKEAAKVLLRNAGVDVSGETKPVKGKRPPQS